jgi:hypothetical protein
MALLRLERRRNRQPAYRIDRFGRNSAPGKFIYLLVGIAMTRRACQFRASASAFTELFVLEINAAPAVTCHRARRAAL